jgi:lipoyl(octanoyl) transferase
MNPLSVLTLGRIPYAEALALQRGLREARIAGKLDRDVLLLLEHEPTVTLGRGTRPTSLPLPPEVLASRGLTVMEVERGGDVTWHGPGQLVGYPILDLEQHRPDLHWYLRQLEQALIGALLTMGIHAERNPGLTGVWTRGRKIASLGVHVRRWVTTHGFALNVTNDLRDFDLIVPCGIQGVEMTTVARELLELGDSTARRQAERKRAGGSALWDEAIGAVIESFATVFERQPVAATMAELEPRNQIRWAGLDAEH